MIIKNFSNIQLLAESGSGAKQIPEGTSKFSVLMEKTILADSSRYLSRIYLNNEFYRADQQLNATDNGIDKSLFFNQTEEIVTEASQTYNLFLNSAPMKEVASTNSSWLELQTTLLSLNPNVGDLLNPNYARGFDGCGPIFNCTSTLWTFEGQESSSDNPIMYVMSKGNEKYTWYEVTINQVNPRDATREEMFALMTYTYKDNPDPNVLVCATFTFDGIDQHGAKLGLFSENDIKRDYVAAFQAYSDICKGYLASADYAEHMKNMPAGARDYTQMAFDMLLEMIDNMIERSERFAEHEKHTDIDEPGEMESINTAGGVQHDQN